MNSPSHRANILSSEFTTLGVGYNLIENDPDIKYGTFYRVQLFDGIKELNQLKLHYFK